MKYELFSKVSLKMDVKKYKLKKGDMATIVEYYPPHPKRPAGYSVEVFNGLGQTIGVYDIEESKLEQVTENSIPTIRKLRKTA